VEQIKLLKLANSELGTANKSSTKQAKSLATENEKLAADYKELEEANQRNSSRGHGKGTKKRNELKAEQRVNVSNQIKWFVKAVLFCTHKEILLEAVERAPKSETN
jgi:cobalamin biosynthesis protein CbiD